MLRIRHYAAFAAISCLLAPAMAATIPAAVTQAVKSPARPPAQISRDETMKPEEVLAFAGIRLGMKVVDFSPGDGYYTRLLAKLVGPSGKVYAFVPQRGYRDVQQQREEEEKAKAAGQKPDPNPVDLVLPLQHTSDFKNVMVIYSGVGGGIGLPEQVDAIFTAGAYHDFHNDVKGPVNNKPLDMASVNKALFRTLKPGGLYIVSDNAAAKDAGFGQTLAAKRSEADAVKKEATDAGFTFVAESNALANPADDHNGMADANADRFVLKFQKPANAMTADKRPGPDAIKLWYGNTFVLGTPDKRFRTIFYHADHTYQEFGMNDMQVAHWYWDVEGRNCMYHEMPAEQESFTTCHPYQDAHRKAKLGDTFKEGMGERQMTVSIVPGYQYPNIDKWSE